MSLQLQIPQHFLTGRRRNEYPAGSLITFITTTRSSERGCELIWGLTLSRHVILHSVGTSAQLAVDSVSLPASSKWVPGEVSRGEHERRQHPLHYQIRNWQLPTCMSARLPWCRPGRLSLSLSAARRKKIFYIQKRLHTFTFSLCHINWVARQRHQSGRPSQPRSCFLKQTCVFVLA